MFWELEAEEMFRLESAVASSKNVLMAYCVRSRESTLKQYMHFFSEQSTCEQGKKTVGRFFHIAGLQTLKGM